MGPIEQAAGHLSAMNWHAVRLYRLSHWPWRHDRRALATVVSAFSRSITGIEIPPSTEFGDGPTLMQGVGIIPRWAVREGSDCTLYQQVTLGSTSDDGAPPRLGDRVTVFAGVRVLGDIQIGDGAQIGADAVVLSDLPSGATAVGVPARILARSPAVVK